MKAFQEFMKNNIDIDKEYDKIDNLSKMSEQIDDIDFEILETKSPQINKLLLRLKETVDEINNCEQYQYYLKAFMSSTLKKCIKESAEHSYKKYFETELSVLKEVISMINEEIENSED